MLAQQFGSGPQTHVLAGAAIGAALALGSSALV
jgi:hypothetical protein